MGEEGRGIGFRGRLADFLETLFWSFFRVRFWEASWSALCSLLEPRGAKSEHFGWQKVPKKYQKSDFLQNQGKLIWSGKYHTTLRVGPSKKALKTVQKGA